MLDSAGTNRILTCLISRFTVFVLYHYKRMQAIYYIYIYIYICIYIYNEELKMVVHKLLACTQPNCHETFTALWNTYRRVSSRGRRAQIRFSQGVRREKPENDHPPFWFYRESIQTSIHGDDGNAEAADSVVAYDQGCKAQENVWCKVIAWDEATMSCFKK